MGVCALRIRLVVFENGMLVFEIRCWPHALSRIHDVTWLFGVHSRHLAFARSGEPSHQPSRPRPHCRWIPLAFLNPRGGFLNPNRWQQRLVDRIPKPHFRDTRPSFDLPTTQGFRPPILIQSKDNRSGPLPILNQNHLTPTITLTLPTAPPSNPGS